MERSLAEMIKENHEREIRLKKEMIVRIKKQQRIDAILGLIIGLFVIGATLLLLIDIPIYHQYDANRDGKVSAADYVTIKNYIMEQ